MLKGVPIILPDLLMIMEDLVKLNLPSSLLFISLNSTIAFLNSMPVVNVDNIPITHSLIIRDLSELSLANDESNPTHNSYIAITKTGYGYPFTCNINQINQMLSFIIDDINQRINEKL